MKMASEKLIVDLQPIMKNLQEYRIELEETKRSLTIGNLDDFSERIERLR